MRWFGGFCFTAGSGDKAALHPAISADMSEELMSLSEVPIRHETYEGVQAIFIHTREIMDISGFLLVFITGIIVIAISYALDHLWAAAMPVRAIYLFIRLPGVVLHECAHIIGCLLTGARIRNVVLFSKDGGSVTYTRPRLPYIGDVIISTAPLFLLPLALSFVTWIFGSYLGCVFPAFPATLESTGCPCWISGQRIFSTFSDNLLTRFNGWFLLYLYLTISLVLSVAPSTQDMKNAAAGSILLVLAGITRCLERDTPGQYRSSMNWCACSGTVLRSGLSTGLLRLLYRCRSFSGTRIRIVHKASRIDQMGII